MLSTGDLRHLGPVAEVQQHKEKARRWSPFVCPDCRVVFRIAKDHDGEGIVCPSCRRMLRIPREGEQIESLLTQVQDFDESEESDSGKGNKKTRSKRKKKAKEAKTPDWDASSGHWKTSRSTKKKSKSTFGAFSALFVIIAASIFLILNPGSLWSNQSVVDKSSNNDENTNSEEVGLLSFGLEDEEVELPRALEVGETKLFTLAEKLAIDFLAAESVEEILPLVRQSEGMEEKIRTFYRENALRKIEISKFNISGDATLKDDFFAVDVLTSDFETRQMAFFYSRDELKVDWESWVGWSEMSWDQLIEKRPSQPVVVRAILTWVDYYNFEYSDESEWRSFRLTPPEGEPLIYGYVPRNSTLDKRLRPSERNTGVAVTLRVRFLEQEKARNQVRIADQLADGWVLPNF